MHEIEIVKANLSDSRHQSAVLCMMDADSADPMGDAKPLSDFTRLSLISGLLVLQILIKSPSTSMIPYRTCPMSWSYLSNWNGMDERSRVPGRSFRRDDHARTGCDHGRIHRIHCDRT